MTEPTTWNIPASKTMLCLILDRSGSMGGRESDVINGVNSFIAEQKKLPNPATIALVRFDTESIERFRPMRDLREAYPISRDDYQPRGGTPLLDAVGRTITELDNDWKAHAPNRAIVVIVTDGQENSSREFSKAQIKQMIESREKSGMWSFIYLGADKEAFAEAHSMGIQMTNTAQYHNTTLGTRTMYAAASNSIGMMRSGAASASLGGVIPEDPNDQNWVKPTDVPAQTTTTEASWTPPTGAVVIETWHPPA